MKNIVFVCIALLVLFNGCNKECSTPPELLGIWEKRTSQIVVYNGDEIAVIRVDTLDSGNGKFLHFKPDCQLEVGVHNVQCDATFKFHRENMLLEYYYPCQEFDFNPTYIYKVISLDNEFLVTETNSPDATSTSSYVKID